MVLNANNHYDLDDFKFRFLRGTIVFLQSLFTTCLKKSTSPIFSPKNHPLLLTILLISILIQILPYSTPVTR
jgi:hypothetical protein